MLHNKYLKYKMKYYNLKYRLFRLESDNIFLKLIQYHMKDTKPKCNMPLHMPLHMPLPVFELYQYNIVNYPQASKQLENDNLSFTSILESEEECPSFAVQSGNLRKNNDTLSLCDVITDEKPGNKIECFQLTIDNYYENFHKYLYSLHSILKPKYFNKYNIGNNEYDRTTIIDKNIVNSLLDCIIRLYDEHHIMVINVSMNNRFIIIGDFHGSIHSFIRILYRLQSYNILDMNTMMLKENYYLIFLGDIIDRGMFSVEILTTILLLLKVNKDKVVMIAGNHEASMPTINSRDGFETEIQFKYNCNKLYTRFNELFSKLPVAVLLHEPINKQTIWLSHGCFNANINYKLKDLDYSKISRIDFSSKKKKRDIQVNSILWSDIDYVPGNNRSAGDDYYNQNTREEFLKFMKENNITGVIRGHQDNYSNSIIYYHNNMGTNYMKINDIANSGKCNEKQICYNKGNDNMRTNGALARIVVSTNNYNNTDAYQPIITISTATDMKKSLIADSFGLLRFDINNMSDFTTSL